MSFAYMPFYTGDYYRDTRHLSMLQHGAYRQLLDHCWDQKGPLPLDMPRCFRICGAVSKEEQEAVLGIIGEFFVRMDDGHYNRRMQQEIERAAMVSGARSDAAHTRWKARESLKGMDAAARHANAMQVHSKSNASATPHPHPQVEILNTEPTALVATAVADGAYRVSPCPTEKIVALYAQHLPMLPQVAVLNDARKRAISSRWREVCGADKFDLSAGLEWFGWFFSHVRKSKFLIGNGPSRDGRAWKSDFDWLLTPTHFARVVEGRYHQETV